MIGFKSSQLTTLQHAMCINKGRAGAILCRYSLTLLLQIWLWLMAPGYRPVDDLTGVGLRSPLGGLVGAPGSTTPPKGFGPFSELMSQSHLVQTTRLGWGDKALKPGVAACLTCQVCRLLCHAFQAAR